ncbi:MAG: hypothetical protein ACREL6_02470 [Gemmatimonadales bacterium]
MTRSVYCRTMIGSPPALLDFNASYARSAFRDLSYGDALARFTALWCYAREINPEMGNDWQNDLRADFAVALAVNGLPPAA